MIIPSFRQAVGRKFQSSCHYVKSLSTARLTIDKVVFINWFLVGWRPSWRKIKVMLALIIVQQPLANSKSTRKPRTLLSTYHHKAYYFIALLIGLSSDHCCKSWKAMSILHPNNSINQIATRNSWTFHVLMVRIQLLQSDQDPILKDFYLNL